MPWLQDKSEDNSSAATFLAQNVAYPVARGNNRADFLNIKQGTTCYYLPTPSSSNLRFMFLSFSKLSKSRLKVNIPTSKFLERNVNLILYSKPNILTD